MKTDSQIQQDVIAELKWEPAVDATTIGVAVIDGVVSLSGTVSSYAHKWHAERAAERVNGVKSLAISIEVELPGSSARSDVDIARAAENALQWVSYLPKDAIRVVVESGWITLSGQVDWDYQRQTAASAVRYLVGVKGLTDLITLKTRDSSSGIKSDIEAALKRRSDGDARDISVAVKAGEVTLTGTVPNWWQREAARESAWAAPGVQRVIDKLNIDYDY
jgi:VCBS repeat-containing protein